LEGRVLPEVRSLFRATQNLVCALYPYVYLLVRAALAERATKQIAASVAAAQAIQAPFDREIIGGKDAPGRQRIQKTIDSLVQQSKDLVDAATAIGITRLTLVNPK